jgi:hypothetical protein
LSWVKAILYRGLLDKISKFMGAPNEIFLIEDSFGDPAEETRHAMFEDLAARTEQRSLRIESAPKRDEVGFIAAGTV